MPPRPVSTENVGFYGGMSFGWPPGRSTSRSITNNINPAGADFDEDFYAIKEVTTTSMRQIPIGVD